MCDDLDLKECRYIDTDECLQEEVNKFPVFISDFPHETNIFADLNKCLRLFGTHNILE